MIICQTFKALFWQVFFSPLNVTDIRIHFSQVFCVTKKREKKKKEGLLQKSQEVQNATAPDLSPWLENCIPDLLLVYFRLWKMQRIKKAEGSRCHAGRGS